MVWVKGSNIHLILFQSLQWLKNEDTILKYGFNLAIDSATEEAQNTNFYDKRVWYY